MAQGKVVLAKNAVAVADIVAAAVETASPVIESGKHSLLLEVPKHGIVVDADRGRLTQVLANLLTNAAKYTPAGGQILVTAAADGDEVEISVKDSGTGISPELLPRVFDLFVQSRQTLDRSQGGLGLGLALVKNLVTMHGGSVAARSAGIGQGSTFIVRLPRVEAPAASREVEEAALPVVSAAAARQRVLVVDDNEDGAYLLAELLARLGYQTAIAHDGPGGLQVAGDFEPHVALLDIGLPGMDGYELARLLRSRKRDLKLVAVTGYGQDRDRQLTEHAGFEAHLTKPIDLERLTRLMATFKREEDDAP